MVEQQQPKQQPVRPKVDHFDVCILAGFPALVAGIWMLSPPWALIIGGIGLVAYGLVGNWRQGEGGE